MTDYKAFLRHGATQGKLTTLQQDYWISFGLYRQIIYMCVCVYICVYIYICMYIFVVVELSSHVQLFASPWTAARQASLSLTISWSLPKFPSSLHWRCIQPSHPASLHVCVLSCLVMPVSLQPHRLSGRRLPGSPVNGILQARILEWVAIPFSRDLPNPEI